MLNIAQRVILLLFLFCSLHLTKFHTMWPIANCKNLKQKKLSLYFFECSGYQ